MLSLKEDNTKLKRVPDNSKNNAHSKFTYGFETKRRTVSLSALSPNLPLPSDYFV